MKRIPLLFSVILSFTLASAQDSSRLSVSLQPLVSVMSNSYSFNPITEELPAHYTYNSPVGFGAAFSLDHLPTRIGVNLMYQHYIVKIGEEHTGKNLSSFSTKTIVTKQGESRFSIVPYYNWSKNKHFKLATGIILTHVRNKLNTSKLMRQDGQQIDAAKYRNGYTGTGKTAYGVYACLGMNLQKISISLFGSYELTDTRYFSSAENAPRNSIIWGLSAGYLIFKK